MCTQRSSEWVNLDACVKVSSRAWEILGLISLGVGEFFVIIVKIRDLDLYF